MSVQYYKLNLCTCLVLIPCLFLNMSHLRGFKGSFCITLFDFQCKVFSCVKSTMVLVIFQIKAKIPLSRTIHAWTVNWVFIPPMIPSLLTFVTCVHECASEWLCLTLLTWMLMKYE